MCFGMIRTLITATFERQFQSDPNADYGNIRTGINWPLPEEMTDQELYKTLFLPAQSSKKERPLPNWDEVCQELRCKRVTLLQLRREYKDKYPNGLGYTQFCTRCRAHVKQISPVMKQVHKACEKTFVDYAGMTVPWFDPTTGEIHEAEIFVGCLGASQYTFVEPAASQQLHDWIGSHIRMWAYFGGVSKITVPDNLKSGVTKSHRFYPDINRNHQTLVSTMGLQLCLPDLVHQKIKLRLKMQLAA